MSRDRFDYLEIEGRPRREPVIARSMAGD